MASPCRHCHRPPHFRCLVSMDRPAVVVRDDVDDHRLRDRLPGRAWVGDPDGGYGGHRPWRHERYPVQKCRGPGGGDQARRHHFRQNRHAHRRSAGSRRCCDIQTGGHGHCADDRCCGRAGFRSPACAGLVRRAQGLAVPVQKGFENIEGMGARAEIDGEPVFLGNRRLMDTQKLDLGELAAEAQRLQGAGRTVVHVARAGKVIGLIAIADAPRSRAAATVAKLRERGVQVAMLTGDNAGTAHRIARDLGLDIVLADVLPGQKAGKVKELQAQGKKVGMVGDGVNDAPALTQADVGFAIGAGTDVAIESADVVLMKSDPYDVVGAVELSHATLRKMHQNLWWAVGYNVIAFPLAAGVFYPFLLSPEIAALAMSGSSALVAINALMLKRTKLAGITRRSSVQTSPLRTAEVTA